MIRKNIGRRFRRQLPWKGAAFTAAVALFSILTYNDGLSLGYTYGAFALYLVFIFRIDSRIPIAAALLLLAATPFYLIRNLEAFANHLATLAYFFLVIGVIKQFYELKSKIFIYDSK